MPIPSITILPSFGEVLSIEEKQSDQTLLVTTENVENTQVVSVVLATSPSLAYTGAMADNSSTITFPTADLQQLTIGQSYSITASVANIYGDSGQTSYNFTVGTTSDIGTVEIRGAGVTVGFASVLDFADTVPTVSSGIATIVTGGVGGIASVEIRNAGVPVGFASIIDFSGTAIDTIDVSSGIASVSIAQTTDTGSTGISSITRQVATASGITSEFTITDGYDIGYIDVYLNGVKQRSGTDFTATDGTTVTMTPAINDGDVLEFQMYKGGDGSSGGGSLFLKRENNPLGIITTINLTGQLVTASVSDEIASVGFAGTVDAGEY